MKRIVCYGDSNTWGYVPGMGDRYDENTRWTALLKKNLPDDCDVIEAGMNSRTISFDDPMCDYLNGRKGLMYTLLAAKPVELLVVSLGTNDLKYTDARGSAKGLDALLHTVEAAKHVCSDNGSTPVLTSTAKLLVISPISLHPSIDARQPPSSLSGKYSESLRFGEYYQPVCRKHGAMFFDAAQYISASEIDGIHMSAKSHAVLSLEISKIVRATLKL